MSDATDTTNGDVYPIERRRSISEEVVDEAGLLLVAGVWLIFSPAVLGYTGKEVAYSDVIAGILLIMLSLWHIIRRFRDSIGLILTVGVGFWIAISGFVLESTSKARVNEAFIGLVVILLTVRIAFAAYSNRMTDS